jgi:hypothetical protein
MSDDFILKTLKDTKAELWDAWHSHMSEGQFENHWLIQDLDKAILLRNKELENGRYAE